MEVESSMDKRAYNIVFNSETLDYRRIFKTEESGAEFKANSMKKQGRETDGQEELRKSFSRRYSVSIPIYRCSIYTKSN